MDYSFGVTKRHVCTGWRDGDRCQERGDVKLHLSLSWGSSIDFTKIVVYLIELACGIGVRNINDVYETLI